MLFLLSPHTDTNLMLKNVPLKIKIFSKVIKPFIHKTSIYSAHIIWIFLLLLDAFVNFKRAFAKDKLNPDSESVARTFLCQKRKNWKIFPLHNCKYTKILNSRLNFTLFLCPLPTKATVILYDFNSEEWMEFVFLNMNIKKGIVDLV